MTVSVTTNLPSVSKSSYLTAYSAVVMSKPVASTTPPSIGYTSLTAGSTLTANPGTWSGSPAPKYAYTWYTCQSSEAQPTTQLPATTTCIERAKSESLTVLSTYKGLKMLLKVVASNAAGEAIRFSTFVTIP